VSCERCRGLKLFKHLLAFFISFKTDCIERRQSRCATCAFVPAWFENLSLCVRIAGSISKQYVFMTESVMKQPITIRLDSELLATARMKAKEENRTLTNFLETALKERFDGPGITRAPGRSSNIQKPAKRNFKRSSVAKS
jgi:hypothetical protein